MERQTTFTKPEELDRQWYVIDAEDLVLGRMATKIAMVLMGKHKPSYTPFVDDGDFVIVLNAKKVKMTGKKWEERKEKRFSGYPGGLKEVSYAKLRETHPDRVIHLAVSRMLPKNKLGNKMLTKLKVYAGSEHPHQAQNPQKLELN